MGAVGLHATSAQECDSSPSTPHAPGSGLKRSIDTRILFNLTAAQPGQEVVLLFFLISLFFFPFVLLFYLFYGGGKGEVAQSQ